jgi:hypothetical protein
MPAGTSSKSGRDTVESRFMKTTIWPHRKGGDIPSLARALTGNLEGQPSINCSPFHRLRVEFQLPS